LKIAETVLKRRAHDIRAKSEIAKKTAEAKRDYKRKARFEKVVTAQSLVKKSLRSIQDKRRLRKLGQRANSGRRKVRTGTGESSGLMLVVRNEREAASVDSKNLLQAKGLNFSYFGILLPNNKETKDYLHLIDPYVFYGYASSDTVRALLQKRGEFVKDEAAVRRPFSDNNVIETALGHLGIICVDDIFHELWNCGKHAEEILKILRPFKLSSLNRSQGLDGNKNFRGDLGDRINETMQFI